jgi:hypothetical protein
MKQFTFASGIYRDKEFERQQKKSHGYGGCFPAQPQFINSV